MDIIRGTRLSAIDQRPRVLLPGFELTEPGTERHRVRGGGATIVAVGPGDQIDIVDPAGGQIVDVVVFDQAGTSRPELVGLGGGAEPARLYRAVSDTRRVRAGLAHRAIDDQALAEASATRILDRDTQPGARVELNAHGPATVAVCASGTPMSPHDQDPATDLIVWIRRAELPDGAESLLPTPLADPLQDFRIDAATATAYQVKAGEFIQIIDVEGWECSDFQALTAAALDRGQENPIDATTTRSLMGASYPGPGLYSKFFGADMAAMVEVIQDTVGRHDTFNLACTAKYYDDMGYPGHVNCTDNINAELDPYGVAPRMGWEAVNFFYNTNVDALNQIYLDEPWSRPGDYVLLRALTDLVCVSTACPCDIDAANGWVPTDIHVRTYSPNNLFKKATAFRMTADADAELTRETGFHPRTADHTRNFAEYQGFWLANSYTAHGAIDEYWACRQAAAIIDLSPLRKYEVTGPDAEELLQTCLTRNVAKLADGQVSYTAMCYDTGGMIDDGTIFRLGRENFRWVGGADTSGLWLRDQAERLGLRAWARSSTDQLHNVQVQGPNSREILRQVVWTRPDQPTMDELAWFRFAIARIGGPEGTPIVVSRTGYTGELGFEIFCHPDAAPAVWDAIWQAGEGHGLVPMGLDALDILRIEAGLIFAGYEFSDQTDPYEAGIGFTVALKSKPDDFIGRAALVERKDHPQRRLVGLELNGGETATNGDCVHVGRNQVGTITSGTYSPLLAKNIALCRMDVNYSDLGTEVEIGKLDGHRKRIPATVVRFPFYDPDKERVRNS